jgi:hypothetical protein
VKRVRRKIFGSSRQEVIEGRRNVLNVQFCKLYAFPEFVIQLNDEMAETAQTAGVSVV